METAEVSPSPTSRRWNQDSTSMVIMIAVNLVVGPLLAVTMVVGHKDDSTLLLLAGMGLLVGLFVLPVADVVFSIVNWKRLRYWSLAPLGAFAVAAAVSEVGACWRMDVVLRGTPLRPDSFLCGQTKAELTQAAKLVLGKGFKTIRIEHPAEAVMVAGLEKKEVPVEALEVLRKYGFRAARLDDRQSIVVFGYYYPRSWYDYTWAKDGLAQPTAMPSVITEVDIEDWGELIRIAKQGKTATQEERRRISFEPSLVYPTLQAALGPEALTCIANAQSKNDITAADKTAVISALNQQRLVSNALVEHPAITYVRPRWPGAIGSGFRMGSIEPSASFEVVTLLRRLLSEGVISHAPDGQHLRIRSNLTDRQRLEVEWLHVEIMNHIYGNLLRKWQHPFQKELGDNWYFNQW